MKTNSPPAAVSQENRLKFYSKVRGEIFPRARLAEPVYKEEFKPAGGH